MGDLNAIISSHERDDPPLRNPLRQVVGLNNTINSCELIGAGYVGDIFTWERDGTRKRLDRMLVNLNWRLRFNEVDVHPLPFFKSDHIPLLIKFISHARPNRHRQSFWFEAVCLTHHDFNRVVKEAWQHPPWNFSQQLMDSQNILKD